MANLIITNQCNLNCPFCFASENQHCQEEFSQFNLDAIKNIIPFLDKSKKVIRLCGGEPTLNKDIIHISDYLLDSGFSLFIMTNGLWPLKFRDYLKNMSGEKISRISFLFNVLHENLYSAELYRMLHETLSIVNPSNSTLGITIYDRRFEYEYIIDLCKKYNISTIRISVAAPNLSSDNYNIENNFYEIADRLMEFINEITKNDIKVVKDCGYISPCFFSESQQLKLKYEVSGHWNFSCASSVSDIDEKGNAWRCYGLYSLLRTKIGNFGNEVALKKHFDRRMRIISTNLYPYQECVECSYWQKSCLGGCFVIRIKKTLEQRKDIVFFPIDDNKEILNCIPKKSRNLVLENRDGREILFHDKIVLKDIDQRLSYFFKEINGRKTLRNIICDIETHFDSFEECEQEVVKMFKELFEMDLINIIYDYGIRLAKRPVRLKENTMIQTKY
jgi:sulfatase maturation enzyme AslB (radical SAM superfamily)